MCIRDRVIGIAVFLTNCDKPDDLIEEQQDEKKDDEPTLGDYISDYPHNLNVVYFVPSDSDPLYDYHRRLSGIMLHMQEWFKKEMKYYGFGEKTFGMEVNEKDASYVRIIIVKGKEGKASYPYEGGGSKAGAEIEAYFSAHPDEKASDHTIVFMPSLEGEHGWDAGGVPFYGMGRSCYVLDYKYFDISTWMDGTKEGKSNWIGGTIHELGHGLNLPHNQHRVNDGWLSMMSWGNHDYNYNPDNIHLTKASAAILNNCQVFSKDPAHVFYDAEPSHTIKSFRIYADDTNLYLRCKFTAEVPVNAVIAYNDPKTSADDSNYNAISWCTTNVMNGDSISMVMPLNGINPEYKSNPFDLSVRFCHENGNFSYESFKYEYKNGKPDIDVNIKEITKLDNSNWMVAGFSSEEASGEGSDNGRIIHAIDNNTSTFWHSEWSGASPNYPHYFIIDMGQLETVNGFTFIHRNNKYNGRPKDITIETSNDNTSWKNQGSYELSDQSLEQMVELTQASTFRYFKVTITTGYNEGGEDVFFTHLAEIGAY
jgi:hypothetical protein